MFQIDTLAKWLMIIGLGIAALGGLIFLAGKIPFLNRLGNLPGDFRYVSPDGRFGCFFPIVTMLLISVVLTIVLNVIARLLNR
ncbi:MAG: DUF2905 domain-containing protein [Anaerolineae bacterium]|nr:DUF2905 domain-containing protein [Anaerolineae bacterium]